MQLAGRREFAVHTLERDTKDLMQIGAVPKCVRDGSIR